MTETEIVWIRICRNQTGSLLVVKIGKVPSDQILEAADDYCYTMYPGWEITEVSVGFEPDIETEGQ